LVTKPKYSSGCNLLIHKILFLHTSCAKRFYDGDRKLLLDTPDIVPYG
jgi:hypothetical protein